MRKKLIILSFCPTRWVDGKNFLKVNRFRRTAHNFHQFLPHLGHLVFLTADGTSNVLRRPLLISMNSKSFFVPTRLTITRLLFYSVVIRPGTVLRYRGYTGLINFGRRVFGKTNLHAFRRPKSVIYVLYRWF